MTPFTRTLLLGGSSAFLRHSFVVVVVACSLRNVHTFTEQFQIPSNACATFRPWHFAEAGLGEDAFFVPEMDVVRSWGKF